MEKITIKNKGMRRLSIQSPHLPGGSLRVEAGETVTEEVESGVTGLLASLLGKQGVFDVRMETESPIVSMPGGIPAEADTGDDPENDDKTDSEDDEV